MAVTPIAGKPGVYRHTATQFVVHDVYNVEQLVRANGVLVEWDGGHWAWKAGRDLRDMLMQFAVTSLQGVCDAMIEQKNCLGSRVITNPKATNYIAFPMLVDADRINGAAVARSGARIFAIVTNVHSGNGRSLLGQTAAAQWGSRTPEMYVYSEGYSTSYANTKEQYTVTAAQTAGGFNGRGATQYASDASSLLGTATIAVPLGMTWEQFAANLIKNLNFGSKSEVQEKCHLHMDPLVAKMKAAVPLPYVFIPVEITTGGTFIVNAACAKQALIASHEASSTNLKGITLMPLRGGVSFNHLGMSQTCDLWLQAKNAYSGGEYCYSHGQPTGFPYNTTGATTVVSATPMLGTQSRPVRTLDGIRIERVLGGLAGQFLSDTGETNPVGENVTSAECISMWREAIYTLGEDTTQLARKAVVATGLLETDAEWQARLEAASATATPQWAGATQLTTWDMHGISAAVGMMALLASLDDGKTDEGWMLSLWPDRRRVTPTWVANSLGGGPTKVAFGPRPVGTLFP